MVIQRVIASYGVANDVVPVVVQAAKFINVRL